MFLIFAVLFPPVFGTGFIPDTDSNQGWILGLYLAQLPLSGLLLAFVWRRCSQPNLSFWDGLCTINSTLMSGCVNLTILYLLPTLTFVYFLMVVQAALGLFKGKEYTEQKWAGVVGWFCKHGIRGRGTLPTP